MNAKEMRMATAFYYGARSFTDVYKNANDDKLAYWEKCKEWQEYLDGEMRILTANKFGYTVGILYTNEKCQSCMKVLMGYKYYDFVIGDYVKFARRVYARNVNKTIKRAWEF